MEDKKFLFGVATAAYQIEGTHQKFKTIWDDHEDKIDDQSNCHVACDFYQKYEDDIALIKALDVDVYRMSISWARIQPTKHAFSQEGIDFYHQVFKILKDKGIQVDVTLYHWDQPKWLYEMGVGFDDPSIVSYFLAYATKMFDEFDGYVRAWATINEPWCVSVVGYYYGAHAPFVKDLGRMARAQYYTLMIHKAVYQFYKARYHKEIGIVFNLWHKYLASDSKQDQEAMAYSALFFNDMYLSPMFKGVYPKLWFTLLQENGVDTSFIDLDEVKALKNQTDYLGINYYTHHTVAYDKDSPFKFKHIETGYPLTAMGWEVHAMGLIHVIEYVRENYTDKDIYITENGAAFDDVLKDSTVNDIERSSYIKNHLQLILDNKEKLNIKGYYVWSLMDNFEWAFGYTKRFGIVYVDYKDLKRYPKDSYYMYQNMIKKNKI